MMYRDLGHSGLKVSAFTMGAAFFASALDESAAERILMRGLDAGINALDTAESYGPPPGASEMFLGKYLGSRRADLVISSKVGPTRSWLEDPKDQGLSRRNVISAVEGSLRRLHTDYIDVVYAHFPCPTTPLGETLAAFEDLVKAGKVRAVGLSNHRASRVVEALWIADTKKFTPIAATQDLYNLFERVNEWDLYPVCTQHRIGVVAYAVLAGGLLSGNYTPEMVADHRKIPSSRRAAYYGRYDDDRAPTRSSPKLTTGTIDAVSRLQAWATERGWSLSQVAIAWALSHPAVTSVLIGVSSIAQFESNLRALNLDLSDRDRVEIADLIPDACINRVRPTW